MHTNYRGLTFLLSLGSLPLACTKDTDDTDGNSSTTANTDPTGTGTETAGPTEATAATDATSTGGMTTTGMGQTDTATSEPPPTSSSDTSADTGFETEETGPPPATDPNCIAYQEHIVECIPRYAEYQNYLGQMCEGSKMYGMTDGDACVQSIDAYYVCMSMADCAEITAEEPPACQKETTAIEATCPSMNP